MLYLKTVSQKLMVRLLIMQIDFINTPAMPINNLIEYGENYSDSSGSLWGYKRDDIVNNADVTNNDNAPSFKYKQALLLIVKQIVII